MEYDARTINVIHNLLVAYENLGDCFDIRIVGGVKPEILRDLHVSIRTTHRMLRTYGIDPSNKDMVQHFYGLHGSLINWD